MRLGQRFSSRGFTLIEILITVALSSVIIATVYQTFYTQQRSFTQQTEVTNIQQGLRAGMYLLTREIRSAGYDTLREQPFGFVTSFPAPNNAFVVDYAVDTTILAFTLDANGNGTLQTNDTDNNGDGVIDINDAEQIAYRYNAATRMLERFSATAGGGAWAPVLANIDAVNFVFRASDGTVTTDPATIAFVEISLLIRADDPTPHYVDSTVYQNKHGVDLCPTCDNTYQRRLLVTTVQVRNAGL